MHNTMKERVKSLNFLKVATTIILLTCDGLSYNDSGNFCMLLDKRSNINDKYSIRPQRVLAGKNKRRDSIFTNSIEDLLSDYKSDGKKVHNYGHHHPSRYNVENNDYEFSQHDIKDDDFMQSQFDITDDDDDLSIPRCEEIDYDSIIDLTIAKGMNQKDASSRYGESHHRRGDNIFHEGKKHSINTFHRNDDYNERRTCNALKSLDNYDEYASEEKRIVKKFLHKSSTKEYCAHGLAALSPILILTLLLNPSLMLLSFFGSVVVLYDECTNFAIKQMAPAFEVPRYRTNVNIYHPFSCIL
ncbi:variable surface protein [Plasmodium gonderi]|uniref:Variable surface protein n=1 Tax=Plasmodium gonderi TaxID=77519 RepID=A0A1Y1JR02_PLAGO|nr:variable surface protein [Plasmodium gonderi]GAW84660.1 variable surface protein [Plasmodium gonderi]